MDQKNKISVLFILLLLLNIFTVAHFDYPSRRDVSFGGKLVNMQQRFTTFIAKQNNEQLVQARQLSKKGMVLNDKMENYRAIISYDQAELLVSKADADPELKSLLLAEILQNKGRSYHYLVQGALATEFVNKSRQLNESLIHSRNLEIARFAYFFLATNYDMLEGIIRTYHNTSGKPYALTAVKIKKDILQIRGVEMGRSFWNYAVQFRYSAKPVKVENDTLIRYCLLAEKEFELDKEKDRVYNSEFISTNYVMLAERYWSPFPNIELCKKYAEKAIACLSVNNSYKFPGNLPPFIDGEEVMRTSRPLSACLIYIFTILNDKRYIRLASDLLDSAVTALSSHTAETFDQEGRNTVEMNELNKFVINTLFAGKSFPIKDKDCLGFLTEIEKVSTFNYQKKLQENQIIRDSKENGQAILAIRKLKSKHDSLQAHKNGIRNTEYLERQIQILTKTDSLERLNYKELVVKNNLLFNKNQIPDLNNIYISIKPTSAILLYYFQDYWNLCGIISKNETAIHQLPASNEFKTDLRSFQELNVKQDMLDSNWLQLSHKIYKKLVAPYVKIAEKKELVIIPSGILHRIPFEALVTSWSRRADGKFEVHYLGEYVSIRYEYSLQPFYTIQNATSLSNLEKVYTFAPSYEKPSTTGIDPLLTMNFYRSNIRSESFPLKFNIPEATMAALINNGKAYTKQDATEKNFRSVADQADLLHLSMHSSSQGIDPMYWGLVFTENKSVETHGGNSPWIDDGILYAYEIYNMHLKSKLVVLSACETGIGRYETGEGTRSLGLAFRYAGCNNTLISLWKVDDEYTSILMEYLYKYLHQGIGKAEALTLAKRDFVKRYETTGPYFWAGFILYGDNEAFTIKKQPVKKQSAYPAIIIGLLLLLPVSLLYFRKILK